MRKNFIYSSILAGSLGLSSVAYGYCSPIIMWDPSTVLTYKTGVIDITMAIKQQTKDLGKAIVANGKVGEKNNSLLTELFKQQTNEIVQAIVGVEVANRKTEVIEKFLDPTSQPDSICTSFSGAAVVKNVAGAQELLSRTAEEFQNQRNFQATSTRPAHDQTRTENILLDENNKSKWNTVTYSNLWATTIPSTEADKVVNMNGLLANLYPLEEYSSVFNDKGVREYNIRKVVDDMRRSLINHVFAGRVELHVGNNELYKQIEKELESAGYNKDELFNKSFPDQKASIMAYLKYIYKSRTENSNWIAGIAKKEPIALAREQLMLQAYQYQLDYIGLQKMENIEMLLANMYSLMLDSDRKSLGLER